MMSISWTTLQEQILAKLRRPYRSEANMNEVGHALNTPKTSSIRDYLLPSALFLNSEPVYEISPRNSPEYDLFISRKIHFL
jgi:hypothetical protein